MTESRNYRLVHGGGDDAEIPHVLVVGGGYLGLYTARRLEKKLGAGEARITVIDPNAYMTYQPFLPEAAAGSISPRNVVVPLRKVFDRVRVLGGRVVRIDHADRVVRYEPNAGEAETLHYDYLVMAAGAVSRTLPIPGLAEGGVGIKTVEEAAHLRNHVLNQLTSADATSDPVTRRQALNLGFVGGGVAGAEAATASDPAPRRKALIFVFVGGGFAGAEAVTELEDMVRDAVRVHPTIDQDEVQFYLIEAADKVLPEVGPEVGEKALNQMRRRGIDVRLNTFLESATDQHIKLSDGTEFDSATLVWTAGVKPSPVVAASDLPLGPKGHVDTSEYLTVNGVENAFAGGDNAQVPDGEGGFYPPNAQNAVRMAPVLADNVIAALRGGDMTEIGRASCRGRGEDWVTGAGRRTKTVR